MSMHSEPWAGLTRLELELIENLDTSEPHTIFVSFINPI